MVNLYRLVGQLDGVLLYLLAQTGSDVGHESLAFKITTGQWLLGFTSAMHPEGNFGTPIANLLGHWLLLVFTTQQKLST
jgi:hypothetical protein